MASVGSKHSQLEALCKGLKLTEGSLQTPIKHVITVSAEDTLIDSFRKLIKNNILSAPVQDEGKWIGFLDLRDLCSYVNHLFENQKARRRRKSWDKSRESAGSQEEGKSEEKGRSHLDRIIDIAALEPTITVRYLAKRNPFRPLKPENSLWDVMELMAKRIKRIPILDKKGQIINIISQSSVMRLLSNNLDDKKIVKELTAVNAEKIGQKPVISVHKDTLAHEVFKVMSDKNLSGIAVVDSMGSFLCSTQASDLKLYLADENLSILRKPIRQFLAQVRQQELVDLLPNVSVKPSDTLAHVIEKIAVIHMHRVFVADPKAGLRPQAVISISDVLRHIFGFDEARSSVPKMSYSN